MESNRVNKQKLLKTLEIGDYFLQREKLKIVGFRIFELSNQF